MKLDHGNPNKPLSECDQKLPIIFIVQEILSLWLVETNGALHISDTSFYKTRNTDRHFCHRLRLDVFIKLSVTGIFFLSKFLCKNNPKECTRNNLSTK